MRDFRADASNVLAYPWQCSEGPLAYLKRRRRRYDSSPGASFQRHLFDVLTMDILTSLFVLFSFFHLVTPITLPPPNGPFNVAITDRKVTDPSRRDPYSTSHAPRSLMLTLFHPISKDTSSVQTTTPYMPAQVAAYYDAEFAAYGIPNGTFASINLTTVVPTAAVNATHDDDDSPACHDHPTILFSPGLGGSRLVYATTASALAAQGFTVITIDHPYDSPVVVFPDGSVTTAANITSAADIQKAFDVRSDDIVFLASRIRDLSPCHCTKSTTTAPHIFAAGHSLGGAASVDAVRRSKILKASANLDGALLGAETDPTTTLSKPTLLFGSERNATLPSWTNAWPRILGPKVELELKRSKHATFTDFPFLVDTLGFRDALGEAVEGLLGTIDADDALQAVVEVLAAWSGNTSGRGAVEDVVSVAEGNSDLAVVRR